MLHEEARSTDDDPTSQPLPKVVRLKVPMVRSSLPFPQTQIRDLTVPKLLQGLRIQPCHQLVRCSQDEAGPQAARDEGQTIPENFRIPRSRASKIPRGFAGGWGELWLAHEEMFALKRCWTCVDLQV